MLPRNLHDAPARLPRTDDGGRKNSLAHLGPKFSPGQVTAREPLCALISCPNGVMSGYGPALPRPE